MSAKPKHAPKTTRTAVLYSQLPTDKACVVTEDGRVVAVLALWDEADRTDVIEYLAVVLRERFGKTIKALDYYDLSACQVLGVTTTKGRYVP